MDPEIKALWIEELKSGRYEQGKGFLSSDGKFCCLGVLCEIAVAHGAIEPGEVSGPSGVVTYDYATHFPSSRVIEWAGLPVSTEFGSTHLDLANENDRGVPFAQIAELIQEHF